MSELYVFHFVAVTRKLSITADDQIAELYVDGIATPFAQGGWQVVRTIDIPDETQVIAVKAIDIAKVCSDAEMQCNVRIVWNVVRSFYSTPSAGFDANAANHLPTWVCWSVGPNWINEQCMFFLQTLL